MPDAEWTIRTTRRPDPAAAALLSRLWPRLWAAASNAGGAIGFTHHVTEADVQRTVDREVDALLHDDAVLCSASAPDGTLLGTAVLAPPAGPLQADWRTVARVMVDPAVQGRGLGLALLGGVHAVAHDLGLHHTVLEVRGGLGLEHFYARAGYVEIGRHPRALRVGPGDLRDLVTLMRPCTAAPGHVPVTAHSSRITANMSQ